MTLSHLKHLHRSLRAHEFLLTNPEKGEGDKGYVFLMLGEEKEIPERERERERLENRILRLTINELTRAQLPYSENSLRRNGVDKETQEPWIGDERQLHSKGL